VDVQLNFLSGNNSVGLSALSVLIIYHSALILPAFFNFNQACLYKYLRRAKKNYTLSNNHIYLLSALLYRKICCFTRSNTNHGLL